MVRAVAGLDSVEPGVGWEPGPEPVVDTVDGSVLGSAHRDLLHRLHRRHWRVAT